MLRKVVWPRSPAGSWRGSWGPPSDLQRPCGARQPSSGRMKRLLKEPVLSPAGFSARAFQPMHRDAEQDKALGRPSSTRGAPLGPAHGDPKAGGCPLSPQFGSQWRAHPQPGQESEAGPLGVVGAGGVGPLARGQGAQEIIPEKGEERGQPGPLLREVWKDPAQPPAQILMGLFWSKG